MYYDDDPSVIVIYDYDSETNGENTGKCSWEYCDSDYSIQLIAPTLYDEYDSCYDDMMTAIEIGRRAPVYFEGKALFKTRRKKGRFELFYWGDGWGFYLVDDQGKLIGVSAELYETQEKALSAAAGISENINKGEYHYLNYKWHEDHPRSDEWREVFMKQWKRIHEAAEEDT